MRHIAESQGVGLAERGISVAQGIKHRNKNRTMHEAIDETTSCLRDESVIASRKRGSQEKGAS